MPKPGGVDVGTHLICPDQQSDSGESREHRTTGGYPHAYPPVHGGRGGGNPNRNYPPLGSEGDWKCEKCYTMSESSCGAAALIVDWRRRTHCIVCDPLHPSNYGQSIRGFVTVSAS